MLEVPFNWKAIKAIYSKNHSNNVPVSLVNWQKHLGLISDSTSVFASCVNTVIVIQQNNWSYTKVSTLFTKIIFDYNLKSFNETPFGFWGYHLQSFSRILIAENGQVSKIMLRCFLNLLSFSFLIIYGKTN